MAQTDIRTSSASSRRSTSSTSIRGRCMHDGKHAWRMDVFINTALAVYRRKNLAPPDDVAGAMGRMAISGEGAAWKTADRVLVYALQESHATEPYEHAAAIMQAAFGKLVPAVGEAVPWIEPSSADDRARAAWLHATHVEPFWSLRQRCESARYGLRLLVEKRDMYVIADVITTRTCDWRAVYRTCARIVGVDWRVQGFTTNAERLDDVASVIRRACEAGAVGEDLRDVLCEAVRTGKRIVQSRGPADATCGPAVQDRVVTGFEGVLSL
jgi:hypothetical protein